jgi:hypothetical protein
LRDHASQSWKWKPQQPRTKFIKQLIFRKCVGQQVLFLTEDKKRIIKLTADIGQSDVQSKRNATTIQQQTLRKLKAQI